MVVTLLVFLAQVPGGGADPGNFSPPSHTSREVPSPLSNPAGWVTTPDYPLDALRQGLEGTVGFALTVNPQGMVDTCRITHSSGHPALDEATCTLIARRARFKPGQDAAGKAIAANYASRVQWKIPRNMPPPQPFVLETSFVVETDGRISDCRVIRASGAAAEQGALNTPCQRQLRTTPVNGADGKPARVRVRMNQNLTIAAEPAP